ncbi:hypothetical protein MTBLM5_30013 [Magnetospirillum sp. LM-5]|nr:hypothetical protein MTBLM5_30013 [Magnetospirillum sp. LM-5]
MVPPTPFIKSGHRSHDRSLPRTVRPPRLGLEIRLNVRNFRHRFATRLSTACLGNSGKGLRCHAPPRTGWFRPAC